MAVGYRISIGVDINASGAKSGSAEAQGAVNAIGGAAEKAKPKIEASAAAVEKLDKAGAGGTSRKAIDDIGKAAEQTETKVQRLINASVGLHSGPANENARQWTGILASEGLAVDNLRSKYDPMFATISRYKQAQIELRTLHAQGAMSSEKMREAMSRERQEALASIAVFKGRGQAIDPLNLRPDQKTNLMYQGYDTVQSLALGMPLAQVAMQQGPQAIQIYGGVGNAMKALSAAATPLRLATAGVSAVAIAGAMAWNDYLKSVKEVETAAAGLGRAAGGSTAGFEAAANAGAEAAGIAVSSARSMEVQFLRTGRIGSENFQALISLSKDFAATIGIGAGEAGAALAEMFADPGKAADTLYRQYGLIDGATSEHARRLAAQNRLSEAQAVLLAALPNRLADASEATTGLGRAWAFVATNAKDAWDWIGKAVDRGIDGPSEEERLADAQKRVERFSGQSWFLKTFNGGQDKADAAKAEVDDLTEIRRRRNALEFERTRRQQSEASGVASVDIASTSAATSEARRRRELEDEIAALSRGRNAPNLSANQRDDIAAAIDAKTRALETLIPAEQRAAQLGELDIRIQTERNPLIRANLVADRERLQLAGEEISTGKAQAQIVAERNRVIQEILLSSRSQSQALSEEASIRRQFNDMVASGNLSAAEAQALLRTEIQLRPLAAAAAAAQGEEQKKLNAALDEARATQAQLEQEQRRAGAIDVIRGQQDDLARLKLERDSLGASSQERARAISLLEAEQMIRERGYTALSKEADMIRANAKAQADANLELERTADAWSKVTSTIERSVDAAVDKLTDGDLKGAAEEIGKDILGTLKELSITNPLKNALTGGNAGTLDDVGGIGGIFSKLFGRGGKDATDAVSSAIGSSVSAMSVTAGTVMINGGIGGGLSDPFKAILGGNAANDNSPSALSSYAKAIQSIESGGRYDIMGPVTKSGDRAYGAYQVMGNNVGPWSKAALGRSMSPSEFLGDRSAQDAVFNHRFGGYVGKYGASGAAQAWFGGPGSVGKGGTGADILGTTGNAYVEKFNTALGRVTASTDIASQGLGQLGGGLGQFSQQLVNASNSGGGAAGGGFLGMFGKLIGGISPTSSLWAPNTTFGSFLTNGYETGGWTGDLGRGDIAGFVHGQEFVVNARTVAKPGVRSFLHALNDNRLPGYDRGGFVAPNVVYPSFTGSTPSLAAPSNSTTINNYSSASVEHEETTDERGGRHSEFTIADTIGSGMAKRGGGAERTMARVYGVGRKRIKR